MTVDMNKVIDRIHKLLALARDGSATEAEAELAMAKAQEQMAEYNLSMATIEAKGGKSEGRIKTQESENLLYAWKRELLEKIAKVNFCHISVIDKTTRAGQRIGGGYEIIGRQSNVAATRNMFDYLLGTIEWLIVAEVGISPQKRYNKWSHSFRVGCADRLKDRLQERHDAMLEEQARKAREENARSQHPSAAPGTALVVVMKDYAQNEDDLNNDFIYGWEPGTTARRRAERAVEAERSERRRKKELERILADNPGIDPELAYCMACGWSRDSAEQVLGLGQYTKPKKIKAERPETERQRQKRKEREERQWRREQNRQWRRDAKTDWSAYHRGQEQAEGVGLDEQVSRHEHKKVL